MTEQFGIVLKGLRAIKNKTQAQLAKLTGLSQSLITRLEKEKRTPRLPTILILSLALRLNQSEIQRLCDAANCKMPAKAASPLAFFRHTGLSSQPIPKKPEKIIEDLLIILSDPKTPISVKESLRRNIRSLLKIVRDIQNKNIK